VCTTMIVPNIFFFVLAFALSLALPHAAVKRQVLQLRPSYDFIVAGGGTAGLTVADRLTEAFPESTVRSSSYASFDTDTLRRNRSGY
jgi:choline dehydrogenase